MALSRSLAVAVCVLASVGVVASIPACGTTPSTFGPPDGAADGTLPPDDDGGTFKDVSTGDTGPCGTSATCSGDLHSVVDCNGATVQTCPPTEGCANGQCIPACDASKVNKSSVGCEYFTFRPRSGGCYAMFLANTWNAPVKIQVEYDGQSLPVSSFARIPSGSGASITYQPLPNDELPVDQVAILFLLNQGGYLACPAPAASSTFGTVPATGYGKAFHVTTSAPVVAYSIDPYGGGNSFVTGASLLYPTSAWDTNYIGVSVWPHESNCTDPKMAFVGSEDGTTVTISPSAAIVGGAGVMGTAQGVPITYNLARGEVLQLSQFEELTGSAIQSNKPIGLIGSQDCFNINDCCCDGQHQQIPAVRALGSEYAGVRYRDRGMSNEASMWRIVGAVDGTQLTWEPAAPMGAPTSLALGTVARFASPGPFVVRSQDDKHPFYVAQYMTGGSGFQNRGDPEMTTVVPTGQFLNYYVFFTDPTYPETNLVYVRAKAPDDTFKDVELDCVGKLSGWQPVGTGGKYEYTRFDLVTGNFQKNGSCDTGRHVSKSDGPFSLTIWGWGSDATMPAFSSNHTSYAYPAGASARAINTVVVPPAPK